MKKNKTEVVFVIDKSGSMESIKKSTQEGLINFINKQKELDGECFVTLFEFDSKVYKVAENLNIKDLNEYTLNPSGWTALLDAIGISIDEVGARLCNTNEEDRPEKVIFAILSDGEENSSKEYTKNRVAEKIKHQKEKYSWTFIFLGCNQDALFTGGSLNINKNFSLTYNYNNNSVAKTFDVLVSGISCLRSMSVNSYTSSLKTQDFSIFDEKDRKNVDVL